MKHNLSRIDDLMIIVDSVCNKYSENIIYKPDMIYPIIEDESYKIRGIKDLKTEEIDYICDMIKNTYKTNFL